MATPRPPQPPRGGGGNFLTAHSIPGVDVPNWMAIVAIVAAVGLAWWIRNRFGGQSSTSQGATSTTLPGAIDPITGVPYSIEGAVNPSTGLPAYYGVQPPFPSDTGIPGNRFPGATGDPSGPPIERKPPEPTPTPVQTGPTPVNPNIAQWFTTNTPMNAAQIANAMRLAFGTNTDWVGVAYDPYNIKAFPGIASDAENRSGGTAFTVPAGSRLHVVGSGWGAASTAQTVPGTSPATPATGSQPLVAAGSSYNQVTGTGGQGFTVMPPALPMPPLRRI